jgi:hypothetical protein
LKTLWKRFPDHARSPQFFERFSGLHYRSAIVVQPLRGVDIPGRLRRAAPIEDYTCAVLIAV